MATYNVKSTFISNRDATPKVLTDPLVAGGGVRSAEGFVATGSAADAQNSTYRMFSVPSNARVEAMKLSNSALQTGCTLNVGVFWPTFIPVGAGILSSVASTAINTTLFASAINCSAAASNTDILNQSTNNGIAAQEQALWQAAGLASDPGFPLDIVVTVQAAVAAAGLIGLKASFVDGLG